MNTGDVSRRIGITVTSALLLELGFRPVGQDKRAVLWKASDYAKMCDAIGDWVRERKHAKPVPKPPTKAQQTAAASAVEDDDDI